MNNPAIPTRQVKAAYEFSAMRPAMGFIVLATDHSLEGEVLAMRPGDAPEIFFTRVANTNPMTLNNLAAMEAKLSQAAALILPESELSVIAYGCTSGTVAIGADAVARRIDAARPGVPCATPITGAAEGFRKLGVGRVSVLTPYSDSINQPMAAFLAENGIEVTAMDSFDIASDVDVSRVPPEAIIEAAVAVDRPDSEAVFVSCTALRAATAVAAMEERIGKPVIASNQALLWQALRLAGYEDPVPGFGRLMEH